MHLAKSHAINVIHLSICVTVLLVWGGIGRAALGPSGIGTFLILEDDGAR